MTLVVPDFDQRARIAAGVAEFVQTGRAVLPLVVSAFLPTIVAGLRKLIADPESEAWRLYIPRPTAPVNDADDGLIRRTKTYEGETADNKWFFHFRPSLRKHLRARGVSTHLHEEFLEACQNVHRLCGELIEAFVAEFDIQCPGYHLIQAMTNDIARDLAPLRILYYDRGTIVARRHKDRDAITAHVAESRPGLRLGRQAASYSAEMNTALLFPGRKLEELTQGRFKALEHDVLDQADSGADPRWSVVYFSHFYLPPE